MPREIENRLNSLIVNNEDISRKVADFFNSDVAVYLELLKNIEIKLQQNKVDPDEIQSILNTATFRIVKKGYELESLITKKPLLEEIKDIFRKLILPWMGQSIIMKRALEKPRGYPGDYEMLEYIYNNKPVSEGIGYYFDRGFLENDLCVAVRNRKDKMAELIVRFSKELPGTEINALNLASGACRELKNLRLSDSGKKRINLACVDHDEMALDYARCNLEKTDINAVFVKEDIISAVRAGSDNLFRNKELIYSIGLIDYLPDRILKKLVQLCYNGLNPGGKLILSHKDRGRYIPMREDWLTDWKFVPRDEDKLLDIITETRISKENIELVREGSGIILFLIITKK